ncbi:deoxyribose-phosphate aldolase [Papillibacter cinnamivorans]|uniref:Deoxyribose-phosphate aldolase n=1 Tax=Papillibacter cinnamivorans DSM 12816 TaxID=1122930 RepID=A0A1W2BVV2_9FIRM|nr:deoxyribose-phosphate aldolase [Papillibacter cinnamivorans]SMC77133.1 deoxyribose-phosphate aldolase [Papillibacter cinnamivorans DSM 12816]
MEIRDILRRVDHTLLRQTATWDEIRSLCDEGVTFKTASVCIPAAYVKRAADYLEGRLPVCTVIGFPNGYSTKTVKCFETEDAVGNGASEIDMVISLGALRDKRYGEVLEEIRSVKAFCGGRLLKVIVEACLLTEEEKIAVCGIVSESGAEYIKTSTGFSTGGATREDVGLMRRYCAPHVRIKAAGGIRTLQDAEDFITLGADRLGTSSIVKIVKEMRGEEG